MDRSMKIKCAVMNGRSKDNSQISAALSLASGNSKGERGHRHTQDPSHSKDRPQPPVGQPYISQVSLGSLTLSWSGSCYDRGSEVTRYTVKVRKVGPDSKGGWTQLTTSCSNTSYRLRTGLEPHAEYRFRVRASNVAGESEPDQESDERVEATVWEKYSRGQVQRS
ncbi:UNVERIFIED_CONTAM: hypothetical protein FKN15_016320 [Acipenser sinensis]